MSMASQLYAPLDVKGQCVLITGASAGIGEACAWRFAEAGCRLVLVARRLERLQALQSTLVDRYGVPVHVQQVDLMENAAIEQLPGQLPADFSAVDILVNNAGLALGVGTIATNDMQDITTMLQTNVTAVFLLTKLFVAGMMQRDRGHVINISSIAGKEAYGGGSGYTASKHALEALTTAARHDLVGTSIRVTSISPGAVRTEFSVVRFKGDQAAADAVYKGIEPLTAADIADNVMYAATRPKHVQVADILVYATLQSSAKGLARILPG